DGGDSFRIESAEKADRGTEIHITLKAEMDEYTQAHKLRQVIKKHSDYVGFPIYIDGEQANEQESLWRKKPSDVEDEAYQKFYQMMTFDFMPPLKTIHFSTDMPVNLRSLLFIPSKREANPMALRKEPGVKLYSNNVLIKEYCTDLLPDWLAFVDGVVDSEDLPLNVSRETVHNNRLMRQLAKVVRKRVLREIRKMSEKEEETFEKFWAEYGRILKEGFAVDPAAKDELEPLLHYISSKSDGKLITLKTYVERMPEDQASIYYVLGDDISSVKNSPHLDPFKAKDWEVLYFVEPIDAFMVSQWTETQGKPLVNVAGAEIELPEDEEEDSAEESTLSEAAINLFIGRCVKLLGERVTEVKLSKVLKDSPVRLIAPEEGAAPSGYDRIQRLMNQDYEVPKRIMEVNKNHPIIVNLSEKLEAAGDDAASEIVDLTIEQLYESALIQEGLHPNPAAMIPRIQKLLEIATKA
ncbi:MAG TPA: molecular chaperone HtpG, partial [Anaerolineae bacterium]|nr:molecular chaperone HtpG [Anaerolineae bacterium]